MGCAKIPTGRTVVDDVTVRGAKALDPADVEGKIATAPSQKFLGVFQGVIYDYQVFTHATLQRDLARIERYYHARGYYSAVARAGRVITTESQHVRVEIVVYEGEPTLTSEIVLTGVDALPVDVKRKAEVAATLALPKGEPFDEDKFEACVAAVKLALTDSGYAFTTVTDDAFVDIVSHKASVTIAVIPGEPAVMGRVAIVGLDPDGSGTRAQELPEEPLRRVIALPEGSPYSTSRIEAAKSALLDLGVFAAVTFEPDLSHPESHVVPLTVRVEPVKLRQVKLGGGIELDGLKTGVHLTAGWEDHNFLGGLRTFSVDFGPGLVFYPTRISNLVAPTDFLPEERLRLQLKQPAFLEARTQGFLRGEVNVFPLLVQNSPTEKDPVVGYGEVKVSAGVDRQFFRRLYVNVSHNVQFEDPFSYKNGLDSALRPLLLSYPDLIARLELVDDHKHPHAGVIFGNDLQVAGGIFGGDARDYKIQPEVRTYVPIGRKVTFATRASVGFLVSSSYGSTVQERLGDPVTAENHDARVRDIETVLFRGFFSGGPTSNRGFPLRGISPHGIVPFFSPGTVSQQVALSCTPPSQANGYAQPDARLCSVPIGGFTLWELSNELRFPVKGALSAAIFCDMSDVSPRQTNLRFDHLHLSCGGGARYDTPVGPIRLDIGYRVQPLQVLGYKDERAAFEADPTNGLQPTFFGNSTPGTGIPVAIALGIGEAY